MLPVVTPPPMEVFGNGVSEDTGTGAAESNSEDTETGATEFDSDDTETGATEFDSDDTETGAMEFELSSPKFSTEMPILLKIF